MQKGKSCQKRENADVHGYCGSEGREYVLSLKYRMAKNQKRDVPGLMEIQPFPCSEKCGSIREVSDMRVIMTFQRSYEQINGYTTLSVTLGNIPWKYTV